MGFIRISEDADSCSGWRSVWDEGEPRNEGWEAVSTNNRGCLRGPA
ncbi:hypothetical protein QF027_008295 [Streptomyces canus]|nr:hypothetical protein [Streptomyces canus]